MVVKVELVTVCNRPWSRTTPRVSNMNYSLFCEAVRKMADSSSCFASPLGSEQAPSKHWTREYPVGSTQWVVGRERRNVAALEILGQPLLFFASVNVSRPSFSKISSFSVPSCQTELCRSGVNHQLNPVMHVLPCVFLCIFIQLGVVPCMSLHVSTMSCHEVCRVMYRVLKYVVSCHGTT